MDNLRDFRARLRATEKLANSPAGHLPRPAQPHYTHFPASVDFWVNSAEIDDRDVSGLAGDRGANAERLPE